MTDHAHGPQCEVSVVILDTNAYWKQFHYLLFEDEKLVARGRAGSLRAVGRKLVRTMTKLGYVE